MELLTYPRVCFFFSSRRRHTRLQGDWSSDVCSSDLAGRDYVTNASLHAKKKILICEDVKRFFPSVGAIYIEQVWRDCLGFAPDVARLLTDRKSTRLNSSHLVISYAVFCLKKKNAYSSSHS